jgi:hypothetical protein
VETLYSLLDDDDDDDDNNDNNNNNNTVNSNSRISNCECRLFSKTNPIIRIFCISGWLAIPINPDKWSSAVLPLADQKTKTVDFFNSLLTCICPSILLSNKSYVLWLSAKEYAAAEMGSFEINKYA